jgi:hypothetical protein
MKRLLCLTGLTVLVAMTVSMPVSAQYAITDLGNLGEFSTFASGLSNNRYVTGNSTITPAAAALEPSTGTRLRAFSWQNGVMTNLGALPNATTNRFARGFGVNDSGVVVGEFNNSTSRAFVYDPAVGSMAGLPRLAGDNDNGVAEDINNAGVIVGISSTNNGGTFVSRATRWNKVGANYVPTDLGSIDGTTNFSARAYAINDSNSIAGFSRDAGAATSQATLWNSNGTLTDLGSLGDGNRFSQGNGLNNNNVVVGQSSTGQTVGQLIGSTSTTGITRAFVWQNGTMAELAPFNLYDAGTGNTGSTTNYHSYATDVNDAGMIVGRSERIQGSAAAATLWTTFNSTPIDLNTLIPANSGWVLRSAEHINANGDIVGFGTFDGVTRGFLLTPVPEPTSLAVMAMVVFAFTRRRPHTNLQKSHS